MSHYHVYISKTLVMEKMEKVENGEDLDSLNASSFWFKRSVFWVWLSWFGFLL
jgi:hypothetical protein